MTVLMMLVFTINVGIIVAAWNWYRYMVGMFGETTKWCSALADNMVDMKQDIGGLDRRISQAETVAGNARARVADLERKVDRSVVYETGH